MYGSEQIVPEPAFNGSGVGWCALSRFNRPYSSACAAQCFRLWMAREQVECRQFDDFVAYLQMGEGVRGH